LSKTPEKFLFLLTGNPHRADQFARAHGALAAHLHESEEEAFLGAERPFHRRILFYATGLATGTQLDQQTRPASLEPRLYHYARLPTAANPLRPVWRLCRDAAES
jgi:hypothetical protein